MAFPIPLTDWIDLELDGLMAAAQPGPCPWGRPKGTGRLGLPRGSPLDGLMAAVQPGLCPWGKPNGTGRLGLPRGSR